MTKFFPAAAALIICASCATPTGQNVSNAPPAEKNIAENKMVEEKRETKTASFRGNLPGGFEQPSNEIGKRLLKEYGAVFIARGGAVAPKTVIFKTEAEVSAFQSTAQISTEIFRGIRIELQAPAMNALVEAQKEAAQNNLTITPRGADSARRNYAMTVELWASRVNPGLAHWVAKGRLKKEDAERIRRLSPFDQVPEIFKLEERGMFFSKDLSKTIIYSVAPPGTSQHLSMLALDVAEFENAEVRKIMSKHGWFQTVKSDLPHFTFLGAREDELPKLGLKKVSHGGRDFWLPDI